MKNGSFVASLCCFLVLTVFFAQVGGDSNGTQPSNNTHVLRLLVLVPFPRKNAGWDGGLELLPAARLAVKHINERSDTLKSYQLELIEASSDACGVKTISNSLVSFTEHAIASGNASNVVGIVGLACSSVTTVISPLAGRREVNLIQLSMGNSPVFKNHTRYPRLWRILPSSAAFVESVIAIMRRNISRTNVSIIYDEGVFFTATANEFVTAARANKLNITTQDLVIESKAAVNRILNNSREKLSRIIFAMVTRKEAALLMCKALKLNLIWPGYLWIFSLRTVRDITRHASATDCTVKELEEALEKTINLDFQYQPLDIEQPLVSGRTYKEYEQEYVQELEKLKAEDRYQPYLDYEYKNDTIWINTMYDEVWAMAVALNNSLPELRKQNLSLEEFFVGHPNITEIVERNFQNVSFAGSLGEISFNPETHEGETPIGISQVQNGRNIMVGAFDPKTQEISFLNVTPGSVPQDEFTKRNVMFPPWGAVLLLGATVAVFALVTFDMIIVIFKWNNHAIKATTPSLSMLLFIGCYILCFAAVTRTIVNTLYIPDQAYKAVCITQNLFFSIGLDLIFGTVVVKLARIFRIFTAFSQMSGAWKDKYLFAAVLVLVGIGSIPAILWLSIDMPYIRTTRQNMYESNPPSLLITRECTSRYFALWYAFIGLFNGILLVFMVFFAYETRKANMKNFKDTKKVNFYVFFNVLAFGVYIILYIGLESLGLFLGLEIINIVVYLILAVNAQVFLYIPKIIPLLFNKHHFHKRTSKSTRRSTLFILSYF